MQRNHHGGNNMAKKIVKSVFGGLVEIDTTPNARQMAEQYVRNYKPRLKIGDKILVVKKDDTYQVIVTNKDSNNGIILAVFNGGTEPKVRRIGLMEGLGFFGRKKCKKTATKRGK